MSKARDIADLGSNDVLETSSTGVEVTGDVSLGDNGKVKLGAGDDLQIYHDGSNSLIKDTGTGNLKLEGNALEINAGSSDNLSLYANGTTTVLYETGSEKLRTTSTGVDVTGTITADGLDVDSGSDTRVLIGESGGQAALYTLNDASNNNTDLRINAENLDIYTDGTKGLSVASNGDVSFYEDTGTTAKMVWDASAENLSINSNGAFPLSLDSDHGETILKLDNSSTNGRRYWLISGGSAGSFSGGKFGVYDADSLSTPFVIDSSGNVGIGTTSPTGELHVYGNDTALRVQDSNGGNVQIGQWDGTTNRIEASGGNRDLFMVNYGTGSMRFATNATERARLDSSGNLLVGQTSSSQDGDAVVKTGQSATINRVRNLANGSSMDICVGSGLYNYWSGFLCVTHSDTGNGSYRTQTNFSVICNNQFPSFNTSVLHTADGAQARSFTITYVDNGIIRLTNTSGHTCKASMTFIGGGLNF